MADGKKSHRTRVERGIYMPAAPVDFTSVLPVTTWRGRGVPARI
jgi:hypothetical protein